MKKLILLLSFVFLVLVGGTVTAQDDALMARLEEYATNLPTGYGAIRLPDFQTLLIENPDVVLLDVREAETEYAVGHLEGSFNVPIRTITQNLNLLPDLDATIIVICKGGARAVLSSASLQILGYTNVRFLVGGYDGWVAEELPVTTDPFVVEPATAPEIDPAVFAAVDAYLTELPEGYGLVSSANLLVELAENPPLLIDVRPAEDFAAEYIEGAQNIWIDEFWANRDQLPADKDTAIVVYCASGVRGGIVTVMLNLMGYTNVRNLSGGLNAWKTANNPTIVAEPTFDMAVALTDYFAGLPETFNAIRIADLKAELDAQAELTLVDVRSADEFAEGFIPSAINIPLTELTSHLDMLPNLDAPIVVYCGSGHRSAMVMMTLNMLGYTNVRSMLSGFAAWTGAEYPTTTDVVAVEAGTAPTFDADVFALADAFIKSIPEGYWVVSAANLSIELVENPPMLVDVRTEGEYGNGYIAGAVHIPLTDFMARVAELPMDANIVVYDNPTHRSTMALVALRLLGYENVRALGGGTGGWEKAGFTLEK